MQQIYFLTYTSKITLDASIRKYTFSDICHISNEHNREMGITGFLCFKKGRFFQYLEGEETVIQQLYQSICQDERHKQVTLLTEGSQNQRQFQQWQMQCFDLAHEATGEEISEYFDDFATYDWVEQTISDVIEDVKLYYQKSNWQQEPKYDIPMQSYWIATTAKITQQHKSFLILQMMLMGIFILSMLVIVIYQYLINR